VDAEGNALISRTHGHHLVHKVGAKGLGDAAATNAKSQQMLEIFQIETVATKDDAKRILNNGIPVTQPDGSVLIDKKLHNLCIAPYEYVHSKRYVEALHKRLEVSIVGTTAKPGPITKARFDAIMAGAKPTTEEIAACRRRLVGALDDARIVIESGNEL
jgi:hypothetical protein